MDDEQFRKLLKELEAIKNLLILDLSKKKVTSDEIGKCLSVSGSTIRKILAGLK